MVNGEWRKPIFFHSPFTIYYSPFTLHCLPFAVYFLARTFAFTRPRDAKIIFSLPRKYTCAVLSLRTAVICLLSREVFATNAR